MAEQNRLQQAQESLKYWQEKLNLEDWYLNVKSKEFNRTDYAQTGDFEADPSNKRATILISANPTDKKIDRVVLHELIHILLWKFDNYCEQSIELKNRKDYLDLLEETVEDLTGRIYKQYS